MVDVSLKYCEFETTSGSFCGEKRTFLSHLVFVSTGIPNRRFNIDQRIKNNKFMRKISVFVILISITKKIFSY